MSSGDSITADDFRAAYWSGIVKRFARSLAAPTSTARALIYGGVWPSRRREVALVLNQQLEREIADLALVRAKIARILEEYEHADTRRENNNDTSAAIAAESGTVGGSVRAIIRPCATD